MRLSQGYFYTLEIFCIFPCFHIPSPPTLSVLKKPLFQSIFLSFNFSCSVPCLFLLLILIWRALVSPKIFVFHFFFLPFLSISIPLSLIHLRQLFYHSAFSSLLHISTLLPLFFFSFVFLSYSPPFFYCFMQYSSLPHVSPRFFLLITSH